MCEYRSPPVGEGGETKELKKTLQMPGHRNLASQRMPDRRRVTVTASLVSECTASRISRSVVFLEMLPTDPCACRAELAPHHGIRRTAACARTMIVVRRLPAR